MAFKFGSSISEGLVTGKMIAKMGESALIVDDCPVATRLSSTIVSYFGFEVSTVKDGSEAVDMYQDGKGHFNLIIIDLEMPIKNGIEATKELRTIGVDCMIIGVTGSHDKSQMQTFMDAGLDYLFNKPLTIPKLKSCFKNKDE